MTILRRVRAQWVLLAKGVVEVIEGRDRLVPLLRKPNTDDRNDLGCALPCEAVCRYSACKKIGLLRRCRRTQPPPFRNLVQNFRAGMKRFR